MPNVSSFGAQTDNAVVSGTVTDRQMIIPGIPPQGLMSVGPRVTPNFVKPREWNAQTTYHFFDAVRDPAGNAYVATKPVVPAGTPLMNEDYWFLWADPDTRFDDLNETVKTFNQRITQNTSDIATKAPINHASEETVYGIGNSLNYGHLKLATDDTPMTSDANAGVAATPKMINDATEKIMIVIGDSYSDASYVGSNVWCNNVAKQLGMSVKNYAKSGCGFTRNVQKKFQDLIELAISEIAEIEKVKLIICYGGVNDSEIFLNEKSAVIKFINTAKKAFPSAAIIMAGSQAKKLQLTELNASNTKAIQEACEQTGVAFVDARLWLYTNGKAYYKDDGLHPTDTDGQNCIAKNMMAVINGQPNAITNNVTISPSSKIPSTVKRITMDNTIDGNDLYIRCHIQMDSLPESGSIIEVADVEGLETYMFPLSTGLYCGNGKVNTLSVECGLACIRNGKLTVFLKYADLSGYNPTGNLSFDFNVKLYNTIQSNFYSA